ncbi:hypothetical protein [Muriicola sp. Z0-33]|uniref:hypothetical protein n=1 Tax=Muriicola sp. Z0-33 TaxID=2816957 RepID=UPI002238EB71|nr:hypothetical protein [Muriicola sp. Z0-33]MCW5516162.1 hypothetical protein [Muriicola sp. Z0-33]
MSFSVMFGQDLEWYEYEIDSTVTFYMPGSEIWETDTIEDGLRIKTLFITEKNNTFKAVRTSFVNLEYDILVSLPYDSISLDQYYLLFIEGFKQELQSIEEAELISEAHRNARRWLLLGCNLGQRGSDLLNLRETNFVSRNGLDVIELTQQKTGKKVTIPILDKTREILEKGLPKPIAIQNFNKYIKELCQIAGINEMVKGRKYDAIEKRTA